MTKKNQIWIIAIVIVLCLVAGIVYTKGDRWQTDGVSRSAAPNDKVPPEELPPAGDTQAPVEPPPAQQ